VTNGAQRVRVEAVDETVTPKAMHMSDWLFTARERFTPANSGWADYIQWIGFAHVEEMVTLDHILCRELIDQPIDEDWSHNVQADFRITWFRDLAYMRRRCHWRIGRDQILAMTESPLTECVPPDGFASVGFDILDGFDDISVLTNCGQFPGIIDPHAVNRWGLLPDVTTAHAIACQVRESFPEHPHCKDCRVWQVARDAEFRT
jgi:hypothetical protein